MILAWAVLEKFPQKPSEAVKSTVFPYNFRPEVDNDSVSDVAVDNVSKEVPIKFGDSRSNGFWDIREADSLSNERTNIGVAYPNSAKRHRYMALQYSKPYHAGPETQDTKSSNTLIEASVHWTDYKVSWNKLAFYSRPFESASKLPKPWRYSILGTCCICSWQTMEYIQKLCIDILHLASRELLGLQYQLTSVVGVQSMGYWQC